MRLSRTILIGSLAFATACGGAEAQPPVQPTPTEAETVTAAPTEPEPTEVETTEAPLVPSTDGQVVLAMWEYGFELDHSGSEVSAVTFTIDNTTGKFSHEVALYRTGLAGDDLPLDDKGDVDETSADLTVVDRFDRIEYQATESWSLELEPGEYVLVCNLPAHYRRGMWAEFDVAG